jgi:uncharacterized protein YkwD
MPFAAMRKLVLIALLAAVVFVPASPARPSEPAGAQSRSDVEAAVVRELNRVRTSRDLPALRSAPGLRKAARSHSRAMLDFGFFGHDSVDGTAFSDRIRRYYSSRGWGSWSVGETLMASQGPRADARAIVSAWLGSPPHRRIVLSRGWRDVGIGALYAQSAPNDFGGAETVVVTADFGSRSR